MTLSVAKFLAENYADYYDQEDALSGWRQLGALDKCSNILRLCCGVQHNAILEIGCGDGAILQRLSKAGFGVRFTGLEISPSAMSRARQKCVPNLDVLLFDGYEVPFSGLCFDLAILTHVLEHVEHPRKLIQEASRVAKNVFIEVPLEDNWRLSDDFVFDRVGHINFYGRKTIRRLVQSRGMEISGAHLCHGSSASYVYRKGRLRGGLTYGIKEVALRLWPVAASACLTYHYALLCKSSTS